MTNYLNVNYDINVKPYTRYPHELASYLFARFNIQKGNTLLDVGCGRGDFLDAFKNLGLNVYALDIQHIDSEFLREVDVTYIDFENESFPFENNSFDFVFSKSVIEHLSDSEHFIKEQYRILRPGGRIICITPDWVAHMKIFHDDHTHKKPYTKEGLRKAFEIYDFQEVQSEIFYQLPILWKHPWLKIFSKILQIFGPVKKLHKNKFIRWSQASMILGTGVK